jgi:hypothetical protein
VPLLRFSRDRRGYEHFYLVQETTRRGTVRNKILYWFRTPPGVKVGRGPFDDDVKRALEKQNPGVSFDWQKLLDTPIPPPAPDVERWRERRRVDREMKQAALAEPPEPPEAPETSESVGVSDRLKTRQVSQPPAMPETPATAEMSATPGTEPAADMAGDASQDQRRINGVEEGGGSVTPARAVGAPDSGAGAASGRRRRRRRGGHRGRAEITAAAAGPQEDSRPPDSDAPGSPDADLAAEPDAE